MEGIVASVKGTIHPPAHVIAFPKYVPHSDGDRLREAKVYMKISSLVEELQFLKEKHPEYLQYDAVFGEQMAEIPVNRIAKMYLSQIAFKLLKQKAKPDKIESEVVEFALMLIDKSGISSFNMGVSGSVMLGFHRGTSDIDLIIHGEKAGLKVYSALKELVERQWPVRRYDEEDLKALYKSRFQDTKNTFSQFISSEKHKILQGKFRERDYFIRLVKDSSETGEVYGEKRFSPMGDIELEATISDVSESIFTPCSYGLREVKVLNRQVEFEILNIASFRGRFCEQAVVDDKVFVKGKLEKVSSRENEYFEVIIGSRKEDVMIPIFRR